MKNTADDITDLPIVDLFAGGGGASTGIRMALGRDPDIAVNHNAEAMACLCIQRGKRHLSSKTCNSSCADPC